MKKYILSLLACFMLFAFVRIAENGMFITLYVAHVVTTEVSSLSKKKQLYN